ncbi:MAG: hypothetical protein IJB85_11705, partial [Clostridia bacterium]|nr:hypothetical protein [Clostridia bacterium]
DEIPNVTQSKKKARIGAKPKATITIPAQIERISQTTQILSKLCQNQKRRLRLLFDSCLSGASRMETLGCRPNPPGDIVPRPLLRFAAASCCLVN